MLLHDNSELQTFMKKWTKIFLYSYSCGHIETEIIKQNSITESANNRNHTDIQIDVMNSFLKADCKVIQTRCLWMHLVNQYFPLILIKMKITQDCSFVIEHNRDPKHSKKTPYSGKWPTTYCRDTIHTSHYSMF